LNLDAYVSNTYCGWWFLLLYLKRTRRQRDIRGVPVDYRDVQRKGASQLSNAYDKSRDFIYTVKELCGG
jgi:hypothetical protein